MWRFILHSGMKPFCGMMDSNIHNRVLLKRCSIKTAAAYVCEFEGWPDVTSKLDAKVLIPRLSKKWLSYFNASSTSTINTITCPKDHVTHTFLACDLSSDCWSEQSGGHSARDGVKCSAPLRPLPPSFGCRETGQYVPYTLVCDHRQDCFDGTDEDFCVFSSGDSAGAFLCLGKSHLRCGLSQQV